MMTPEEVEAVKARWERAWLLKDHSANAADVTALLKDNAELRARVEELENACDVLVTRLATYKHDQDELNAWRALVNP